MKAVYLGKPGKGLRRFICGIKEDDKTTVSFDNEVVAKGAFKSIASVENVHFEKCKRIEESAFENCADLKQVLWMENSKAKNPRTCNIIGINIPIVQNDSENPEGAKETKNPTNSNDPNVPTAPDLEIQRGAFKGCSNLQTVILPKSKNIVIEKEAFGGCQNLRTIVFPCEGKQFVDISGDAFVGCSKVTFVCSNTSTANRYAREHGFEIVNIEG